MEIAIGTANWTQPYGLTSQTYLTSNEIKKILTCMSQFKITKIDTAFTYGTSHKVLQKANMNRDFSITSKVAIKSNTDLAFLPHKIKTEIRKLKIEKFDAILIHNSDFDFEFMKKKLNSTLLRLLNSGMVKRVGISVYTPRELDKFISLSDLFTEIQLPLNPLNQSFRYYLDEFEEISSYRIVVRSIFQQGLLTLNSHSYPPFFKNSPEALNWNNFLKEYEIDALTACIQFIKKISWVNQVVIGINSYLQLQQIFNAFAVNNATVPLHKYDQLHSQNIEIRDPRKWPHD